MTQSTDVFKPIQADDSAPMSTALTSAHMDTRTAVTTLSALAQDTRLMVFRLLIQAGPEGLSAGKIAQILGMSPSGLSFHLKELTAAGLLSVVSVGRYMYYSANRGLMNTLLDYLTENCCAGVACELTSTQECSSETTCTSPL